MQRLIFPATPTQVAVFDNCSYCARFWIQKSDVTNHLHEKQLPPPVDRLGMWTDLTYRDYIYGNHNYWGQHYSSSWTSFELDALSNLLFVILL